MVGLPTSALILLAVCASFLGGCGGEGSRELDFDPRYTPPADAEPGGTLRLLATSDVDSVDPGVTINQFGMMVMEATQRTLLTLAPDSEHQLMPDLAETLPQVDYAAGTVEFKIQRDIHYSPPVNRRVEAGDFKYAIERSLLPGVANGYVSVYLNELVGFSEATRQAIRHPAVAPDISGISAPDHHTLRFRFKGRVPPVAIVVLALPLGAPVPVEYARRFDAKIPSEYDNHVVGTGPYMIPNDPSGRLTGYRPGIDLELVRNPNWIPATDDQPAFLDQITIQYGYSNTNGASRKILSGESMVNGNFPPDPSLLERAATEHPDQLVMVPAGGSLYASLNTTIEPLDDPDVRRAIVAATNRELMRLARGGEIIGPLATHFIPPGVAGFEEAGGLEGPGFDFLEHPRGSKRLAFRYMRRAGYAAGTYDGDAELTMVTDSTAVGRRIAELVRQALETLRIPVRVRSVSRDVMYSRYCNVPRAEVAICPDVGWLSLLGDPQTVLAETFSGDQIQPVNNSNWSQLSVPAIDRHIRRAKWITDPERRARAWASIDRAITYLAPAIPAVWNKVPFISSPNVRLIIDRTTAGPSLSMTSLVGGG